MQVVQHVAAVGERGHRFDERHEHRLRFPLADLNEAVALKLVLQRGCQFGELFIQGCHPPLSDEYWV